MPDFGRWDAGGDPSLNEINRTDQFLDALAAQQQPYSTDHGEAELAHLLAGWRDDVRETPMGHVLTPEDAAAALDRATRPAPRRRFSLAVVGSAAAAMLAIGGFGAVIAGSGPGDALYGLRTMLFGEQTQTRDDAVILAAQTEMQQVQQLIEQGDWQGAQEKLQAVTTTVATVNDLQSRQELVTQWQELTVKVEAQNAAATVPPGAPLPTFPELPAVVLDPGAPVTSDTSDTTSAPSETTSAPSETTTAPSSETTTTVPPTSSPTTTSVEATPSSTSATPSPTSTTVQSTTTRAPSPTSTTARAQLPTSTSVAAPSPTPTVTPTAVPTPSATPVPTPAPTVDEVPPATPTEQLPAVPTTTTPIILLPLPGGAG
ncbi:hypothetical protein KXD97_14105 [Mycobacterium sp. SMC-8]|uniref:anti-sigma-D factor RsdA n=1 Tax=Mycobacterium sp. SMC-8 TaxID=2857060 RepID=UPI0021B41B07|nr:anti-sigma-D factor RsdA [Mycobacterium sp. SMC-8]UXA14790.1 hypothetical protein KXD97_14105 [Mycobacterium sp. SMC-8]